MNPFGIKINYLLKLLKLISYNAKTKTKWPMQVVFVFILFTASMLLRRQILNLLFLVKYKWLRF